MEKEPERGDMELDDHFFIGDPEVPREALSEFLELSEFEGFYRNDLILTCKLGRVFESIDESEPLHTRIEPRQHSTPKTAISKSLTSEQWYDVFVRVSINA